MLFLEEPEKYYFGILGIFLADSGLANAAEALEA